MKRTMGRGTGSATRPYWVIAAIPALFACGGNDGGANDGYSQSPRGGSDSAFADAGPGGLSGGGVTPACAKASASATRAPVDMVFIWDRSVSMQYDSKWFSTVDGLEAFFADPSSKGYSASLQFFPQGGSECAADTYAKPVVPMTALPDSTSFKAQIAPVYADGSGTPTLPAVNGGIAYARTIRAQHPDHKTIVVLVTDGEPNVCSSTVDNVAAAAAKAANEIPLFVIGVGPDTANLDAIAEGGGTAPAIILQTDSPTQLTADFRSAVERIAVASISCSYGFPKPPTGMSLDVDAVNVQYTPGAGGAAQTLQYDAACSSGKGWHYDDPSHPTKVQMCGGTCNALRNDARGKVDVVFGCKTDGVAGESGVPLK